MFRLSLPRQLARRVTAVGAVFALCLTTAVAPPALAQDQSLWGSNANRVGLQGPLRLSVTEINPNVAALGGTLTIKVQVHNSSNADVDNVALRLERAGALASTADARTILAEPESIYDVAGNFTDPIDLKAGQTQEVTLTADLGAAAPEGLGITEPGTYPLFINANGRPTDDIDQLLSETRLLLPVVGSDTSDTEGTGAEGSGAEGTGTEDTEGTDSEAPTTDAQSPAPISLIWPISQPVPLVGGETGDAPSSPGLILTDDSLAESLQQGGRLDGLLSSLEKGFSSQNGERLRESTCIAIDPETLDAVSRMTREYWIGDSRPSPVKSSLRLRDSWGNQDDNNLTHMAANEDAATWLNRLHTLAQGTCVITLPWAGTDVSAVARVGDEDLTAEALVSGQHTVATHLDAQPLPGVYLPTEGYVTAESTPLYSAATAMGETTPETAFEARAQNPAVPHTPTSPEAAADTTVLVADNTAITAEGQTLSPGHGGTLYDGSRVFALPGALSAALAATGQSPQTVAYSNVLGRYDLSLDSEAARMQTAIGTLYQSLADSSRAQAVEGEASEAGEAESGTSDAASQGRATIVAAPPAGWEPRPANADEFIDAVLAAIDSDLATPTPLSSALASAAGELDDGSVTPTDQIADPAPISEVSIEHAQVTATEIRDLTKIMSNDANVVLTRYEFTRPLRRDLLRMFALPQRRNQQLSAGALEHADDLNEQALNMTRRLRNSVTLVAPGGVYTRATQLSPIVVLARNGLPLPVPAYVRVGTQTTVINEKYEASIPAKGSLTVQFTPKAVDDAEAAEATDAPDAQSPQSQGDSSHNLLLWLESPNGTAISQSVSISIQSGVSVKALLVVTIVIITVGGFFAAKRSQRFRK